MADIALAIGIFGALIQLVAFALNLNGNLKSEDVRYSGANALGACCTISYAAARIDIPFLILEATWGLLAVFKLVQLKLGNRVKKK